MSEVTANTIRWMLAGMLMAAHGLRRPDEPAGRNHVWCAEPIRPDRR